MTNRRIIDLSCLTCSVFFYYKDINLSDMEADYFHVAY